MIASDFENESTAFVVCRRERGSENESGNGNEICDDWVVDCESETWNESKIVVSWVSGYETETWTASAWV